LPAGAAIGVDNVDVCVGVAVFCDGLLHGGHDLLGVVVIDRGQAVQVEMVERVRREHRADFTGERAASEEQDAACFCFVFLREGGHVTAIYGAMPTGPPRQQ